MKTIKITLVLCTLLVFSSCNDDNEINDISKFSESYAVTVKGSHPDRTIDSNIIIDQEQTINADKVSLSSGENGSRLTVKINLPADKTASGKKESIGLVAINLDATDIWNVEDTYQTFHTSLNTNKRKKAIIDYVVEEERLSYGSLFRFEQGTISLVREGALLKGTFGATLERDGGTGLVNISGSFQASLGDDDLD